MTRHLTQQELIEQANGTAVSQASLDHLQQCGQCQQLLAAVSARLDREPLKSPTMVERGQPTVQSSTTLPGRKLPADIEATQAYEESKPKVAGEATTSIASHAQTDTTAPAETSPTVTYIQSRTARAALEPGDSLGPYRLESKLGQGGMGAVYKATHTKLDKVVALKVLPLQVTKSPQLIARFEREMKAVGKLDHPQIVRAMDAGEIDGIHYLAMEYVEGSDLQALVRTRGPLSVVNACKAVRQAAQALSAAHAAGLVHRDIKPANLLLAKNGQMKVLDLGLALLSDDTGHTELTTAGQTFGTPDYMAPEQWDNAHTSDGRVDLYALGCTLFFLLTGRAPYATDNCKTTVAKMKAHVTAPIPDLLQVRQDVPAAVIDVYKKLLAKNPEERFQSAGELAAALLPLASNKATTDKPAQPVEAPKVVAQPVASEDFTQSLADAIAELPPLLDNPAPATDSLVINTEAISKPNGLKPVSYSSYGATQKGGQRKISSRFFIAGGSVFGVLLLSLIVITIRNRNGTETVIKVPEGSTVDLKTDPGSQVTIAQPSKDTNPKPASDVDSNAPNPLSAEALHLTAEEYAEERTVAEWAVSLGAMGQARLADGTVRGLRVAVADPLQQFVPIWIKLSNVPIIDEDLKRFSKCKHLKSLEFIGTRINGTGLRHLKPLATLTTLALQKQVDSNGNLTLLQDEGLSGLSDFPQLTQLDLCFNQSLTDKCLAHVSKLTQLQVIELNGIKITDSGLEKLDSLDKLDDCDFSNLPLVTDQGIQRFVEHHPLLKQTAIDNDGPKQKRTIQALQNAKALELLAISSDQLTPDSLQILNSLPKLNAVILSAPTDENVLTLLQIKNLKQLRFQRYKLGVGRLSDESYMRIARYSTIEWLHDMGNDNSPTDERIMILAQSPTLKKLSIQYYDYHEPRRYTEAGIAKLREVRPDLNVIVDGKSYAGDPSAKPLIELAKVEPIPASILEAAAKATPKVERPRITGTPKPPGPSIKQLSLLNKGETSLKLKTGTPISSRALVGAPSAIKELASWSIEPRSHHDFTGGMAMHPDGSRFATVGMCDASIRIWELDPSDPNKVILKRIILGETFGITDSAWSHSGEFLAVASRADKGISIYEPTSGKLVTQVPLKHGAHQLAWSPNDRFLLAASVSPFLIDLATGKVASPEKESNYQRAEWSPDGSQFVTIEENGNVKF